MKGLARCCEVCEGMSGTRRLLAPRDSSENMVRLDVRAPYDANLPLCLRPFTSPRLASPTFQGAFAIVHRAFCPSRNEPVAVKIMDLDQKAYGLDDITVRSA